MEREKSKEETERPTVEKEREKEKSVKAREWEKGMCLSTADNSETKKWAKAIRY